MTHEPQVLGQSAHLWTRTSLRPKDVDVAELYDGFSFKLPVVVEALGFCALARPRISWTAEKPSPATASSRSTRTAASSHTAVPMAWA